MRNANDWVVKVGIGRRGRVVRMSQPMTEGAARTLATDLRTLAKGRGGVGYVEVLKLTHAGRLAVVDSGPLG